tara:strand:+ start:2373 stop:2579 length:207 start_codon:yes stop_codon:yes gene_type:complete
MVCKMCNGTSEIYRPMTTITQEIQRHFQKNGRLESVFEEVKQNVGGTDACPMCSGRAEVEYQVSSQYE